MSDDAKILKFPGGGTLVDAHGNVIPPKVDEAVGKEVERAMADANIRKCIVTMKTCYQMYAAARTLLEGREEFSDSVKKGLIAATFHDLFDPDTKLCRPFDFGEVRNRLRDIVVPFSAIMAGKFMAQQNKAREEMERADKALREKPLPFFGGTKLERGEVYVFKVPAADLDKAMYLVNMLMVKLGVGTLWLSRHKGDSEEFKKLLTAGNRELNIAPVEASQGAFSTRRTSVLSLPLLHVFITDTLEAAPAESGVAYERFRKGLAEKKCTAIMILPQETAWPHEAGIRGWLTVSRSEDVKLVDSVGVGLARWVVQHHFSYGWDEMGDKTDPNFQRELFQTKAEAEAAITELLADTDRAVQCGDMTDKYDPADFRAVQVEIP